jgi:hypothetical protein
MLGSTSVGIRAHLPEDEDPDIFEAAPAYVRVEVRDENSTSQQSVGRPKRVGRQRL